ncbi:MAG: hypothetical protein WDA59_10880 [Methanofastidiosum sp.]
MTGYYTWLTWGINKYGTYTEHESDSEEQAKHLAEELQEEQYTEIEYDYVFMPLSTVPCWNKKNK